MDPIIAKAAGISSKNNGNYSPPITCKAFVLGNYGDPGLEIDTYCDIRSRYVLAVKQPNKRPLIPIGSDGTSVHLQDNLILVVRPTQLWIDCPSNIQESVDLNLPANASKIRRMDANKNVNVGSYTSFSENSISPIDNPYKLGEELTVQKISNYVTADEFLFQSYFSMAPTTSDPSWYSLVGNTSYKGQSMPSRLNSSGRVIPGGRDTTTFVLGRKYFYIRMSKTDYETFIATYYVGKNYSPDGNLPSNYEYYFKRNGYIVFACAAYIDMNVGGKARSGSNACLPSIITTPDSFLTAQVRQPTYLYYTSIGTSYPAP